MVRKNWDIKTSRLAQMNPGYVSIETKLLLKLTYFTPMFDSYIPSINSLVRKTFWRQQILMQNIVNFE